MLISIWSRGTSSFLMQQVNFLYYQIMAILMITNLTLYPNRL